MSPLKTLCLSFILLAGAPIYTSLGCGAQCSETCDNGNEYSVCRSESTLTVITYDEPENQYAIQIYADLEESDDQFESTCEELAGNWCNV